MDIAIKNMKNWAEAEKYLEKHGYGPGHIVEEKKEWEALHNSKPVVEKTQPVLSETPKVLKVEATDNKIIQSVVVNKDKVDIVVKKPVADNTSRK